MPVRHKNVVFVASILPIDKLPNRSEIVANMESARAGRCDARKNAHKKK